MIKVVATTSTGQCRSDRDTGGRVAQAAQRSPAAEAMLAPYYRETISGGGLRITGRR